MKLNKKDIVRKPALIEHHEVNDRRLTKHEKNYVQMQKKFAFTPKNKVNFSYAQYVLILMNSKNDGIVKYLEDNMDLFDSNRLDLHDCTGDFAYFLVIFFMKFAIKKHFQMIYIVVGQGQVLGEKTKLALQNHVYKSYIKQVEWYVGYCKIMLHY